MTAISCLGVGTQTGVPCDKVRAKDKHLWMVAPISAESELDEVLAVHRRSFNHAWTRAMFKHELRQESTCIYVVRSVTGPLVGYCVARVVAGKLFIDNLAVDPLWRRQGAARELLDSVLNDAIQRGARRAALEVRVTNVGARRLYEGLGFGDQAIRRKCYTQPLEDGIVLSRDLGAPNLLDCATLTSGRHGDGLLSECEQMRDSY